MKNILINIDTNRVKTWYFSKNFINLIPYYAWPISWSPGNWCEFEWIGNPKSYLTKAQTIKVITCIPFNIGWLVIFLHLLLAVMRTWVKGHEFAICRRFNFVPRPMIILSFKWGRRGSLLFYQATFCARPSFLAFKPHKNSKSWSLKNVWSQFILYGL